MFSFSKGMFGCVKPPVAVKELIGPRSLENQKNGQQNGRNFSVEKKTKGVPPLPVSLNEKENDLTQRTNRLDLNTEQKGNVVERAAGIFPTPIKEEKVNVNQETALQKEQQEFLSFLKKFQAPNGKLRHVRMLPLARSALSDDLATQSLVINACGMTSISNQEVQSYIKDLHIFYQGIEKLEKHPALLDVSACNYQQLLTLLAADGLQAYKAEIVQELLKRIQVEADEKFILDPQNPYKQYKTLVDKEVLQVIMKNHTLTKQEALAIMKTSYLTVSLLDDEYRKLLTPAPFSSDEFEKNLISVMLLYTDSCLKGWYEFTQKYSFVFSDLDLTADFNLFKTKLMHLCDQNEELKSRLLKI